MAEGPFTKIAEQLWNEWDMTEVYSVERAIELAVDKTLTIQTANYSTGIELKVAIAESMQAELLKERAGERNK